MIFVYRELDFSLLRQALISTITITVMVFFVVFAASVFSLVFRFYGGDDIAIGVFDGLEISDFEILLVNPLHGEGTHGRTNDPSPGEKAYA